MVDWGSLPTITKWISYWDTDDKARTILVELFVLEHHFYLPKERLPWDAWSIFGYDSIIAEDHSMLFDTEQGAAVKLVQLSEERLTELDELTAWWKSRLAQAMGITI